MGAASVAQAHHHYCTPRSPPRLAASARAGCSGQSTRRPGAPLRASVVAAARSGAIPARLDLVDGNGVGRAGRGPSGRPGTPASLDEAAVRSCDSSHARIGAPHLDLVPTRGVAIRGYLGPHEAPEDETRRYATAGDMLIDPPRRMIDLLHDRSMTGGWR